MGSDLQSTPTLQRSRYNENSVFSTQKLGIPANKNNYH